MDARNYREGDRVRLVCMDDEYSGHHEGHVGTVVGICPPPINVLNVRWDDGFGLNPCLDVDVVQRIEEQ